MSREAIYAALFEKGKSLPGLITTSRRLKHWNDVPPSEQPALFQAQGDELPTGNNSLPIIWKFNAEWYLYCHSGNDPEATPATQLNDLLDAVEQALKPDVSGFQTLGGLVYNCRISGKVETDEGLLGPQSVAVIPIEITFSKE